MLVGFRPVTNTSLQVNVLNGEDETTSNSHVFHTSIYSQDTASKTLSQLHSLASSSIPKPRSCPTRPIRRREGSIKVQYLQGARVRQYRESRNTRPGRARFDPHRQRAGGRESRCMSVSTDTVNQEKKGCLAMPDVFFDSLTRRHYSRSLRWARKMGAEGGRNGWKRIKTHRKEMEPIISYARR